MLFRNQRISLAQIQWIIWILLFGVNVITLLRFDSFAQSVVYSFIMITSYMIIIYGNASFLIPKLFQQDRKLLYFIGVIILLVTAAWYRTGTTLWAYNSFFTDKPETLKWLDILRGMSSTLLIYFTSILFYISLHYFRLREQQEAMQRQQLEAELNLLKAQVQPHFLFNTLNNIYFYAQRESPLTAALLEKLSQIMRYFVDEAPKHTIPLETEVDFIKNYIDLEKARMRYPLESSFKETLSSSDIQVPPMLIIPLVENVFKHGIDKRKEDNFISIDIEEQNGKLQVTVRNRIAGNQLDDQRGSGLANLKNRLALLFGHQYSLNSSPTSEHIYVSVLSIPL